MYRPPPRSTSTDTLFPYTTSFRSIDFYLSPTRSAKAAKRFLGKALRGLKHWEKPATLNTDKAPSYGAAITELKREGKLDLETAHRPVKYLNNVIEADQRKLKILIKSGSGFKATPHTSDHTH